MKKLLTLSVAGSALMAAGCTTAAMANDDTEMRATYEFIVDNQHDGEQSVIVTGVDVEVVNGDVIISGDVIQTTADGRIIISADHANIIQSGRYAGNYSFVFSDGGHDMHLTELRSELEAMENVHIEIEGLRSEEMEHALVLVEERLAGVEAQRIVLINGEERELTDEEREGIRTELANARSEIRMSLREVGREVRESHGERQEALRAIRIELEDAESELNTTRIEIIRAHEELRDNQEVTENMTHVLRASGGHVLRIVSENGEHGIWVDGEELDDDARVIMLEQLEIDRLEGGSDSESRSLVIELGDDE